MSKTTQSRSKTAKSKAVIGSFILALLFASGITFFQVIAFLMVLLMTIVLSVFVYAMKTNPDFAKTMVICGSENKEEFIKKSHYGKSIRPWVWNIAINTPIYATMFLFSPLLTAVMLGWKFVNDINFYDIIRSSELLDNLPSGDYDDTLRKSEIMKFKHALSVKYKDNKVVMDILKEIK